MPLANYRTTVPTSRTVAEIQEILVKHGAREILINYDTEGFVVALSFIVATPYGSLPIRLPIEPDAIMKVLQRQRVPSAMQTREHGIRVAWRIIRDWVRAQMAILETEMVKLEQVFLPYMMVDNKKTLYEAMKEKHFYLKSGEE